MYKLSKYFQEEIIKGSKHKYLTIASAILRNGSKNAILLIRCFLIFANKGSLFQNVLAEIVRNKLIKTYGIYINKDTRIGLGLRLGHPNGVIFGEKVIIGDNVTIYHQVTFGVKTMKDASSINGYPKVEDNCIFYAGAKIIGDISVARGTIIAANAVLTQDTEQNCVYAGVPAKKVGQRKNEVI